MKPIYLLYVLKTSYNFDWRSFDENSSNYSLYIIDTNKFALFSSKYNSCPNGFAHRSYISQTFGNPNDALLE